MGIRIALTIALLSAGWAAFTPAAAHPPTVTISPGYDARLSESRKALARPAYELHPVKPHGPHKQGPKRHRRGS
jgi:hypothetical protein